VIKIWQQAKENFMEKQTMSKKITVGLIGLVILVLLGYIFYLQQQIKQLSQGVNSETVANNNLKESNTSGQNETVHKNVNLAVKGKSANKNDADELNYQLDASEEELDMANKQLTDEQKKKAEFAKNAIELQKKMLQDPATKKMYRDSIKAMLDSTYGALFKELNLSPEKLEKLKELLVDQQMAALDINQEMMSTTPSEENKKELQQRFEDLKEDNDAKLSELLGNGNFEKYATYRDRLSERQLVSNFMQSLGTNDKLTETQQQTLVESMYQERKNIFSEKGYDEKTMVLPSDMDEQGIAKLLERTDYTFNGYIKSSNATLSAAQTEQFKTYLKQQRDLAESQMKLAAQMFGSQTSKKSNEKK
jgi:hypothetical protein